MRKDIFLPLLAVAGGGAGFALRMWQTASAFDGSTMLFRQGDPSTLALIAAMLLVAAVTAVLIRGGNPVSDYGRAFYCPSAGYMTLMTAGGFLILTCAVLGLREFMAQLALWQVGAALNLPVMLGLTAVLCIPAGVCALMLGKGNYRNALPAFYPVLVMMPAYLLLPWIVAQYQEHSRQPETLIFVFGLLGLLLMELGFYFAAAFNFARIHPRLCLFCSVMGVVLTVTGLADRPSLFAIVLSTGCVLLLLAQIFALARNVFGPAWPAAVEEQTVCAEETKED